MASFPLRAEALAPPGGGAVLRNILPVTAWIALALALHFYLGSAVDQINARFGVSMSSAFAIKMLMDMGINIILAVSLTLVNGFTGQFSIGHAGFMALGGYVAAAITYYGSFRIWGQNAFYGGVLSWTTSYGPFDGPMVGGGDALFLVACIVGGVVAAGAGYAVGLPSLRLKGDYLAIVTLGFGEIVRVFLQASNPQLNDAAEIARTPSYLLPTHLGKALGFISLQVYTSVFWIVLLTGMTLLVCYRLKQSSHGRAFLSIREDEVAAEAMGIHTTRYKVRAFVIAAFFAGVAGALFAHEIGSINAGELGFQKSFDILIMVVLGGMGSITGTTLAAIILTILPELLRNPLTSWPWGTAAVAALAILLILARGRRGAGAAVLLCGVVGGWELLRYWALQAGVNLAEYRMIIYALMLIAMMIVRPQGLMGLHELWDLWAPRRAPRVAA